MGLVIVEVALAYTVDSSLPQEKGNQALEKILGDAVVSPHRRRCVIARPSAPLFQAKLSGA